MKALTTILITLLLSMGVWAEDNAYIYTPSELKLADRMEVFCSENPYDCMANKIVTPHLMNTFLYQYYLEIENYFFSQGFESAEFEYCITGRCLEEGVDVKNSQYKITRLFPSKKDYFYAFGGVNQNLGVYFLKSLNNDESDKFCSVKVRPGNKLSRSSTSAIQKNKVISLTELRDKYYKKYNLLLAQNLPKINSFDDSNSLPLTECWLRYKSKTFIFETTGDSE
jgi:hypothetical protein